MKRCYVVILIFTAFLILALPAASLTEAEFCFVNPNGGRYYHARPDCERIAEKHQRSMVKMPLSQLEQKQDSSLTQCTRCYGTAQPSIGNDDPYHAYYKSSYDTAGEILIRSAGCYSVDDILKPGIYTVSSDANCNGLLRIYDAGDQAIHTYSLQGVSSYTFYLGEGMKVSLPAHCTLHNLYRNLQFQHVNQKTTIFQSRFMTMLEIPGREYLITNINGKTGYCEIASIESEMGLEPAKQLYVSEGETISIDLQESYDTFVEFVNCVVWFVDAGNG